MQCIFCGKEIESAQQAIAKGWYVEDDEPICPACQAPELFPGEEGVCRVLPNDELPPLPIP